MDFLIKFSEKPNHAAKKIAIQVAKECDYEFIDGFYSVRFHEINQNLIRLLQLTHRWNTSEIIVDQGKVDPNEVCNILFCHMHERCDGICQKVELIPNYNLSFFINRLHNYIQRGTFPDPRSYECQIIDEKYVTRKEGEEYFCINKEAIIAEVKKQIKIPLSYCDKINERKCLDPIESLPETVKYKKLNFFPEIPNDEKDDEKFEGFSEAVIEQIKAEAEIKAPIYAKAIAKEMEELFKKYK